MDYSDLFQIWKVERSSKHLCKIPKDLYISFDGMLAKISNDIQTSDIPVIANEILNRILFIRKDFVQLRVSKIMNLVIHGVSFDESVLTWGERRIVDSLRRSIETIGVEIPNILDTQRVSLEIDQYKNSDAELGRSPLNSEQKTSNLEFLVVRVLDNVEPFIGLDGVTYGPLEKKDVVYLPLQNATALITRGVARIIEISKDE
jgi:DNA replication initiation complex subunit (GINS family)